MRKLVPLLTLLVAAGAAVADPGYYYEAVTKTDSPNKAAGGTTQVRAWIAGPAARIEFVESPNKSLFGEGSYLVTTDGGRTLKLVDPKEKTWSEIDLEAMLNMAMTMMEGMGDLMKLEFTDAHNEKLLDEPGETLLGRPTTHQRWKTGHTMKVAVMGFNQETRMDTLQDVWFTEALDAEGFQVWLRPDRFRTGNKELDEWVRTEFDKVQGFPLKTVAVTTTESKKGKQSTMTSETVVTELREEDVAAERFVVPEDYAHKPLLPDTATMNAAEQEDQAGQEPQPEQQPGGFGDVKKKLGSLFKKKKDKD